MSRIANPIIQPALLHVEGLSKAYGAVKVLRAVALEVKRGEFVAVLGPSGAGKTTLFRCLARLEEPDSGTLWLSGRSYGSLHGRRLRACRHEMGLISQQFNLIRRLTALENVLAGRLAVAPAWRVMLRQFSYSDRQLALASLDRVGLLSQVSQRADSLSGGQQQRVAIARVLAQHSRLILADEPVASLDPASSVSVLDTLRDIAHRFNIGVLCSLHQVDLATSYADRIIGLKEGRKIFDIPVVEFDLKRQQQLYSHNIDLSRQPEFQYQV